MTKQWQRNPIAMESPVEAIRKNLPHGNGDWVGYGYVYANIAAACERMGANPYLRCSEEHERSMAILGCGHEETMKYEQMRLRDRQLTCQVVA